MLVFLEAFLEGLNIKLFKNDHVPTDADTEADYDEADFDGYAQQTMSSWTTPYTNPAGRGELDETNRVWTQTSASPSCLVYGYYVTDNLGSLVWAERDPNGPTNMNAAGKTYIVYPRFTLRSEP